MDKIDLNKINGAINDFIGKRDWEQFHSLKNLAMALNVECAEFLEILQWMTEEDSNKIKGNPEIFHKVEEEWVDMFFYLVLIAQKTGIKIEEAFFRKLKKNEEKYPVSASKGNSKKYSELSLEGL